MAFLQETIREPGYEQVIYAEHRDTGLRCLIAVHNTVRGPSCGGIRVLPYESREDALRDVLRLARGMSYKSALAGLGFGGGKSVILLDPARKSPEIFQAFGELVDSLGGRYIAAKDMNVTSTDLLEVRKRTRHVLGIDGVPGSSGDPSPVTARGVFRALEATAMELTGKRELKGLHIALQGLGHVGYSLAQRLKEAGVRLTVTDIDPAPVERARRELGAETVGLENIYEMSCDIFSPGARGAVLNPDTIPRLRCRAVAGCANNQLLTPEDGHRLHALGILYAPDYAVNSGGIINIFIEYQGYSEAKAMEKADGIYDTIREIFARAKAEGAPPFVVADRLAEEKLRGER